MEGVPVKISEMCRPPRRVHLSPAVRNCLSDAQLQNLQYSFDVEHRALTWIQQRNINMTAVRDERQKRIAAKQAEFESRKKRERDKEACEAAKNAQIDQLQNGVVASDKQTALAVNTAVVNGDMIPAGSSSSPVVSCDSFTSVSSNNTLNCVHSSCDHHEPTVTASQSGVAVVTASNSSSCHSTASWSCVHNGGTASTSANSRSVFTVPAAAAVNDAAVTVNCGLLPVQSAGQIWPSPANTSAVVVSTTRLNTGSSTSESLTGHSRQSPPKSSSTAIDFNYREFDNQASDPFDSMTLKSLNNMTELARVFDRSLPSAAVSSVATSAAGYLYRSGGGETLPSSTATASVVNGLQTSISRLSYPPVQTRQLTSQVSASNSLFTPLSTQRPPVTPLSNSLVASSSSVGAIQRLPVSSSQYHGGGGGGVIRSLAPAASDAQLLHDFYTRYYRQPRSPHALGSTTANSPNSASATGTLRASRSVPDLTAELAVTSSCQYQQAGGVVAPPPSQGNVVSASSSSATASSDGAKVQDPMCPDGVDVETWRAILRISEMGFQTDRLLKYHQLARSNCKKIIDMAVSARQLQEEFGECGADVADAALVHASGQMDTARRFMALYRQLVELGFNSEKVLVVLRNNGADCRNTAIDLLLQQSNAV